MTGGNAVIKIVCTNNTQQGMAVCILAFAGRPLPAICYSLTVDSKILTNIIQNNYV